jgi:hypothetical protein
LTQRLKDAGRQGLRTAATVAVLDKGLKKGMQVYSGKSDKEVEIDDLTMKSYKNYEKEKGKSVSDANNDAYK